MNVATSFLPLLQVFALEMTRRSTYLTVASQLEQQLRYAGAPTPKPLT